jgi:hypothetical protein
MSPSVLDRILLRAIARAKRPAVKAWLKALLERGNQAPPARPSEVSVASAGDQGGGAKK